MTDNRKWLPKAEILFISTTMKDIFETLTANLGFSTTDNSKKVLASDCNSGRQQPEIATAAKIESIFFYLHGNSYVCPSVCPSITLRYRGHITMVSSKVLKRIISLGSSLLRSPTTAIYSDGNSHKFRVESGWGRCSQQKTCNISETGQDRTKVTIGD